MPAKTDYVEVYEDQYGEYRWRRIAANNEIVADSGQGYTSKSHVLHMAVSRNTEASKVWDTTGKERIEVKEDPMPDS